MNRFKELRNKLGYSQKELADVLYVNQTAVSQWERGVTTPSPNILLRICELYGTTVDYLLGREEPTQTAPKGVKIPVLGYVRAGLPVEAVQEILDYEEISQEMARSGEYFALKIRGDSMEPRIWDGDVVIVRQQPEVENNEVAVVIVNGEDATVKRVQATEAGILLIPYNPSYEPMFYSTREVQQLPVRILGKVVEVRGKL